MIDTQREVTTTTAASSKGGIRKTMQEGIHSVLSNNNKGDQIIGDTRNHVTRDAFNTFLKVQQLDALTKSGQVDGALQIGSLHTHRDDEVHNLNHFPSAGAIMSRKKKFEPNKLKVSNIITDDEEIVPSTTAIHKKVTIVPQNNKTTSYTTKPLQQIEDGDETTESLEIQSNMVMSQSIPLPRDRKTDTYKKESKFKKEKDKGLELGTGGGQEDDFSNHMSLKLATNKVAYKSSDGFLANTAKTKRGEHKDDKKDVKDLEADINHDQLIVDVGVLGAVNNTTGHNLDDSM